MVEDNDANRLLITRQLQKLGHAPTVVGTGEEALEVLAGGGFDAVLVDWRLPGIDGLETTRRIRAGEAAAGGPRLPVVGVTASVMEGDREHCLAAGMDDVIAKPVSLEGLARALDAALGAGGGRAAR